MKEKIQKIKDYLSNPNSDVTYDMLYFYAIGVLICIGALAFNI